LVSILEKSVEKAVASDQFKKFMKENGYGILWKPAAEFDKFLVSEDESKGILMKEAGITK
jgi:tripartite-type tricarboxylate transporter receptor subunit TctC